MIHIRDEADWERWARYKFPSGKTAKRPDEFPCFVYFEAGTMEWQEVKTAKYLYVDGLHEMQQKLTPEAEVVASDSPEPPSRINVILIPKQVVESVESEDDLLDSSVIDSLYCIRALKAAIMLSGKLVEVDSPDSHGQVFIEEFDIGIDEDCYVVIN